MLTLKLLLLLLSLHSIAGIVQEFESFDRKVFKTKKQRYAKFDENGIITLDGTLNGKSNDIGFPNGDSDHSQQTCQKDQKLLFEICETQRLGPWIGLAICYESSLSQPFINPFFRSKIHPDKRQWLVNVMCGPRQNAIFIRRETPSIEKDGRIILPEKWDQKNNASRKYHSFYSISTSFAPKKLYFRMKDEPAEKRCAILQLGGESLAKVNLTTLRREPIKEVYKEVTKGGQRMLEKIVPENDTEFYNHKFPDMANRKYRLGKDQGLWLLLLDFVPPYMHVQNISIYGWLPVRIKITGQAIKPCKVDWVFLQSREVSGGLTASKLKLEYKVDVGISQTGNRDTGNSSSDQTTKSDTTSHSESGGVTIPLYQSVSVGLNFAHSFENTKGTQDETSSFGRETYAFGFDKNSHREETVVFPNLDGTISIEQQVFQCHGVSMKIDRIRYRDPKGDEVVPTKIETVGADADYDDEPTEPELKPIMDVGCSDKHLQCPIWARRDECKKTPVFMLTQCKLSCKICTVVRVEQKGKDPYNGPEEKVDIPCNDQDENCPIWQQAGECNKDPFLMSNICRKSCGLCIPRQDFKAMKKEWRLNEGLDDYDYLYDQNSG